MKEMKKIYHTGFEEERKDRFYCYFHPRGNLTLHILFRYLPKVPPTGSRFAPFL